jgi:hypothetical protein
VDWPFHTIPEEQYCTFMADRQQINQDINLLLRNFSRRDHSTINLMWAWYGAGKTHTLKYLAHRCRKEKATFVPIYNEFPREARSFLDLYRSFVEKIDIELIQDFYLEVFTSPRKDEAQKVLHRDYPDLSNAMKSLCTDREDKATLAMYWLRAQNVPIKDLKQINISSRIDKAEKALKVIAWLIQLFNWAQSAEQNIPARIIWMIDEFQRITSCRVPVQEEVDGCLLSVFNRCPRSFSLFLSFSGNPAKTVPSWLSKEIADRIGIEKVLLLPPLTSSEAVKFISDVLNHYRDSANSPPISTFPFDNEAIENIISLLQKKTEIKPRTIMQACNAVLEEADMLIESGNLKVINKEFVYSVLYERLADVYNSKYETLKQDNPAEAKKDFEKREEYMIQAKKGLPRGWIIIDEAHNYLPGKGIVASRAPLKKYVNEGRNLGLSIVVATQQPSGLDPAIQRNADVLIIHSMSMTDDIQTAEHMINTFVPESVVYDNRDRITTRIFDKMIRSLDLGFAVISNDRVNRVFPIKVRPRITIHGGRKY